MTAKRGMQWKTPWRRQKPSLGASPVGMWFFNAQTPALGDFSFLQPLTTPAIGDGTPPFWVGFIAAVTTSIDPISLAEIASVGRSGAWGMSIQHSFSAPGEPADIFEIIASTTAAPFPTLPFDPLSAPPAEPVLRAVVVMLVVYEENGNTVEQLWVDGSVRYQIATPDPYAPGVLTTFLSPLSGYLNSMAGGNALPTSEEIQTWFSDTRYGAAMPAAAAIPGKTLDQYDAGATPGVVPDPLVNLAGGQNAPLSVSGTPAPQNIFLQATFGY